MQSRFPYAPFVLLVCVSTCGALRADSAWSSQESLSQRPAFRSDVNLVTHAVAVLDNDGQPVVGLTRNQFRVYEDGVAQEITHFLTPDETPLDVALVLDSSSSLSYWGRAVRTSAKTFMISLGVLDCVYVLPFNQQVGPGYWGRALDPALLSRIDGIFMDGGTALYDALYEGLNTIETMSTGSSAAGRQGEPALVPEPPEVEMAAAAADGGDGDGGGGLSLQELNADAAALAAAAAREMQGRRGCGPDLDNQLVGSPQRRRAVVLLTDGADKSSQRRFDEVLDLAHHYGIPIFPVVMGEARQDVRLRTVLDMLAGHTGGAVVETGNPKELRRAYEDVVILLRASYLLGYRPPQKAADKWHDVEVRSRRPSYRLVYRSRYHR